MSIDMFDTRAMTAALDKMGATRPKTFFRDTFFRNVRTFDRKKVDIDVRQGKRSIAAFVSRRAQANVVGNSGYETNTYEPPFISELMEMDFEDLMRRSFGENIYSPKSPQERIAEKLREQMITLDERFTRREEYMAMEALVNGEITVLNGDTIDFQRHNDLTVTLEDDDCWDETTGKPIDDSMDWIGLLTEHGGITPELTIFGTEAFKAFLNNAQVKELLDKLNINIGAITQENMPNGVTSWGALPNFGRLYTYNEVYHNGSTNVALMPSKKIIMASPQARMDRCYGLLTLANEQTKQMEAYEVARLVDKFVSKNPDISALRMQSAPLLVPTDVNTVLVAQVVE